MKYRKCPNIEFAKNYKEQLQLYYNKVDIINLKHAKEIYVAYE